MRNRIENGKRILPRALLVMFSFVLLMSTPAISKDMLVSVAESPDKGVYIDLIRAMGESYTDGAFKIEVCPFNRAIDNVVTGKADFEIPMLRNPNVSKDMLPFRYAAEKLGKVCFVIYSNQDKHITKEMIEKAKSDNMAKVLSVLKPNKDQPPPTES